MSRISCSDTPVGAENRKAQKTQRNCHESRPPKRLSALRTEEHGRRSETVTNLMLRNAFRR
eukprot:8947498-Alexandrium_andersonii.AAC.1